MKNRVALLRREQHMRQEELARAAGISRQSVIAIEKGRTTPSLEVALRMARCFRVPVEAVFFLEGDAWRQRPMAQGACRPVYGQGDAALADMTYSGYPLRYNGGEVIAAYNAMCLLDSPQALEDVLGEFEENGLPLLGGALGTDPRRLPEYFRAHGLTCTPCKKEVLSPGIYVCSYGAPSLLRAARGLHTVALRCTPEGVEVYNEQDADSAPARYPQPAAFLRGKVPAVLYRVEGTGE